MRNQNTPVALEGIPFLAATGSAALVMILLAGRFPLFAVPAVLALLLTLFTAFFFRNPQRVTPTDERSVVAPADGVVIYCGPAREEHLGEEMMKVSIFMSVFNVHINRVPVSGRVVDTFYRPGKFLDVRDERATFENERLGMVLETAGGSRLVVIQVAGLIARRIVCYAGKGDNLRRGERYGLIRFGSRLDVYLPSATGLKVALGDKTIAGETVLGILA
jgi:phosphatidylserine decarboxylase